jgi:hypothetical protein
MEVLRMKKGNKNRKASFRLNVQGEFISGAMGIIKEMEILSLNVI